MDLQPRTDVPEAAGDTQGQNCCGYVGRSKVRPSATRRLGSDRQPHFVSEGCITSTDIGNGKFNRDRCGRSAAMSGKKTGIYEWEVHVSLQALTRLLGSYSNVGRALLGLEDKGARLENDVK